METRIIYKDGSTSPGWLSASVLRVLREVFLFLEYLHSNDHRVKYIELQKIIYLKP